MFYILINIMSINVKVHLYIIIHYIVPALTEAIFPEVKSIVRVDGSEHFMAVSLVVAKMPFSEIPSAPAWTLCCCSCHQSANSLYHRRSF